MEFKKIKTVGDWEEFKKLTGKGNELIIFKHSPFCPTSGYVESEFDQWCKNLNGRSIVVGKVNVITAKKASNAIAAELNVRHESPQVIWLDEEGNVKWHASHYDIYDEMLDAHL